MAGYRRGGRPYSTGSGERSLGFGARAVGLSSTISMTKLEASRYLTPHESRQDGDLPF